MDRSLCGGIGGLVSHRSAPDRHKAYRVEPELLTSPEAVGPFYPRTIEGNTAISHALRRSLHIDLAVDEAGFQLVVRPRHFVESHPRFDRAGWIEPAVDTACSRIPGGEATFASIAPKTLRGPIV